ncbi:MAG: hypothetical protein DRP37_02465 [Thermodesulfobacteriota bacterium]|nr:MAG: hypothetical protein DRP37_02465 [Thermodesulfobacteriota bacterium]
MISRKLIDRRVSLTEISNANKELIDAVEKWRILNLYEKPIKYLFLYGVNFDIYKIKVLKKIPVLVAIV